MKNVRVAKSAGFCFGVKRAVDMVYAQLETNDETKDGIKDPIYTYGPIIPVSYTHLTLPTIA